MINRTRIKDSIYDILDKDQKEIKEYIEAEAEKTPEQKEAEKEKRNEKSNIENINLAENLANQESNPSNQIVIHTEEDNLVHNYFHYFEMYWDAGDCLSSVILKLPKTDTGNTKYWITYTGEVSIYLGNDIERINKQETNESNQSSSGDNYWSIQGMSPIFKGEIGRIKEYQEVLEIHIDSIGKRFKQKIPDEFRQAFINNQNVRDAFQAICEFLGVKYICPPQTEPPADEQTETENATTDGTENDPNAKTQQESQIASDVSSKVDSNTTSNNNNESTTGDTSNSADSNDPNAADPNATTTDTTSEVAAETPQNGYADISFDSGGSIVHGSTVIETSPDMEDTLLALEDHPLDKYLEDTTYVAVDVKKFLDGELFETIHGNYLDYGSITIEPKSSASSEMSSAGATGTTDATGENSEGEAGAGTGGEDVSMPSARAIAGHSGSRYGSVHLLNSEINRMTPAYAATYSKNIYKYDESTIGRLKIRAQNRLL